MIRYQKNKCILVITEEQERLLSISLHFQHFFHFTAISMNFVHNRDLGKCV